MRVLFTSVGRRVELVQAFARSAKKLNISLEIYGADITNTAPALLYCDKHMLVPRVKDEKYLPTLLKKCEEEKIDALIPTIDTDLLLLSENKEKFEKIGTKVMVGAPEKVKVCRDKNYTADYFISLGLKSPKPVNDINKYVGGFPAFIKPKDGSSSIFAYKVNDMEELKMYSEIVPDYIIQPFVEGTEYSVDMFCDFDGNPIYITPRIRTAVRAGEVLKTQIAEDDKIIEEMKALAKDFKPCGALTVQLIRDEATGDDYYIEINPRYGGGAPISILAGADSPTALLKLLSGEKVTYQEKAAEDGALYCRFDQSVKVN